MGWPYSILQGRIVCPINRCPMELENLRYKRIRMSMKYSLLIGIVILFFMPERAYGQDSAARRDTIDNMVVSYYDGYVSVTRLNGGLEKSDFHVIKYDGDRNSHAMDELLGNKPYIEPSREAAMTDAVKEAIGEAKLQGLYRLWCPVVYSRSLNLEYLEVWGQLPMWTSEDYCKVYNILNNVRLTGFKLWKEPVPYVFFSFPIQLADKAVNPVRE